MSRIEEKATLEKTASDTGAKNKLFLLERAIVSDVTKVTVCGNEKCRPWPQPLSPFPCITDRFFSAPAQKMEAPSSSVTLINIDRIHGLRIQKIIIFLTSILNVPRAQ
jgi:hypothetical protein